jgi:hypothetical protein
MEWSGRPNLLHRRRAGGEAFEAGVAVEGAKLGSMRSHAGVRKYGVASSDSRISIALSGWPLMM